VRAPRIHTAALVAGALLSCAAEAPLVAPLRYQPVTPAPEEPFRAWPPTPAPAAPRAPVASHSLTLPNGLRVVVLERHVMPIVTVQLVVDRGAIDASDQRETYDVLAWAMGHGTRRRGEAAIDDAWESLGAAYGKSFGSDGCEMWAKAPTPAFDAAVALLAEQVLAPLLGAAEVSRARDGWRAALDATREDPGNGMSRNARRLLFGRGHPYAFSPPDPARARAVDPGAVAALHARLFQPVQATLIVAGDVTAEAVRESAERWFGAWAPAGRALDRTAVPPPVPESVRVVMIPHWGQTQVQAFVLASLPEVSEADLTAVEVLSHAISGLASPMQALREQNDAIYTLHHAVDRTRGMAYVTVGGAFAKSLAVGSLRTLVQALSRAREGGLAAPLVESARTSLLSAWERRTSTTDGLSSIVAGAVRQGVSVDEALAYPSRLAAVTPADVQRVARRWFGEGSLRAFAIGEPRWIEDLWGIGLGPYQRRNEMGEVLPATRR
jgi:zinc protease